MTASRLPLRRWTPAEEDRLIEMVEAHHSHRYIARKLNRSVAAIVGRLGNKLHICLSDPNSGARSVHGIARQMGVPWSTVDTWRARGWLRIHRASADLFLVEDEALLSFLGNEEHWHVWQPRKIRDEGLREWALELRQGVEFLSIKQAAARLGITPGTAANWATEAKLRTVQEGRGNRYVRADWLETAPTPGVQRIGFASRRPFTPAEISFLREWRPFQPIAHLAAALERNDGSINYKCAALGLSGPIIPAVENLGSYARAS